MLLLRLTRDLLYFVKVYVNDFIAVIIPASQEQATHVAWGVMHGIHNVSPPSRHRRDKTPFWKRK